MTDRPVSNRQSIIDAISAEIREQTYKLKDYTNGYNNHLGPETVDLEIASAKKAIEELRRIRNELEDLFGQ
ncbi:MAG TPA: hypothetical protein VD999_07765 [Vitreimonas sp.]|nr:hypothetical protein [Vitreimonas sp.]